DVVLVGAAVHALDHTVARSRSHAVTRSRGCRENAKTSAARNRATTAHRVTDNARMPVTLDSGTIVASLREGEPVREGALTIRNHFAGDAVSLRVLDLDGTATLRNESLEEVLYVLETDTAIHLPAGAA